MNQGERRQRRMLGLVKASAGAHFEMESSRLIVARVFTLDEWEDMPTNRRPRRASLTQDGRFVVVLDVARRFGGIKGYSRPVPRRYAEAAC